MAECVANDVQPELLQPFRLSRFAEFDLVGDRGAASVGN
jgi:sarcosine oxidase subunit beta